MCILCVERKGWRQENYQYNVSMNSTDCLKNKGEKKVSSQEMSCSMTSGNTLNSTSFPSTISQVDMISLPYCARDIVYFSQSQMNK